VEKHRVAGAESNDPNGARVPFLSGFAHFVERQPPCPRATTILAGFQAAEVGVSFNVSG